MFSFDSSTMNALLIVAVVALFILFVTVLMKLNPSTKKGKKLETEIKVERQKQLQNSLTAPQKLSPSKIDVPRVIEKPLMILNPTIEDSSLQAKQETPTPARNEKREIPKPEKTVAEAKAESASSKIDCPHKFGYLHKLPKNTPIPDECFGCSKIVECLRKPNRYYNRTRHAQESSASKKGSCED